LPVITIRTTLLFALRSAQPDPAPIVPGSMISVQLMTGDMVMSADGTVTYVDGQKIYAFGHRFLLRGRHERENSSPTTWYAYGHFGGVNEHGAPAPDPERSPSGLA
jgi:hypothetical protein